MSRFLVFTALFLSSLCRISACGYSPYGEDVRYSLFNPNYFNYSQYYGFYYNDYIWGESPLVDGDKDKMIYESNIFDWYNYTKKQVPIDEIVSFNNNLTLTDIHEYTTNKFLKYLYEHKKNDVIKYLTFAKKCENFNGYYDGVDQWEKGNNKAQNSVGPFEEELFSAYRNEKSRYLKRKYAFQIIRFAYYNGDQYLRETIFNETFRNTKKDYLYYWSLYFNCFSKTRNGNYNDIAELFANCPEKAFASQFYFIREFNLNKALQFAATPEQKGNLYAYASARNVGKNLENLKFIYQNKPKFKTLDFLLLREINKIEDWVYTPYYTNYSPSIEERDYYDESDQSKITTQSLRDRSFKDRLYARELLTFMVTVNYDKMDNPVLWKAAEIQLLFITNQYDAALDKIHYFEIRHKKEKVFAEIEMIKALCLTARQQPGKAVITSETQAIIEKNRGNRRFVFALGRELEFRGNLLDGMALISSSDHNEYYDYEYNANDVEWRGNRLLTTSNLDVFYTYFDYLDFVYSAHSLQVIINQLNTMPASQKKNVIYASLLKDKDYLTDLLGTKYIREERLIAALGAFRSINKHYWQDNYNAWERDRFDENMLFDENPFYTIKHTDDFIEHKDKYFVNKLSVTEHLIAYLQLANDVKRKDRDYYYFLVANCYLNMSDMGNSWMMRRFETHTNYYGEHNEYLNQSYVDNIEYRTRTKTIAYYNLAYQNSKSDKFRALCLHMVNFAGNYNNKVNKLKEEYPQYSSELSNCTVLGEFFNSRRY